MNKPNDVNAAPVHGIVMRLPECPGGRGCTCCGEGCDCGCVEACPVYLKSNKIYVPPRVKATAEAKLRKLLDGLDSLGIQLVNSGYDDEVVEAITEYIESLRREVKSA